MPARLGRGDFLVAGFDAERLADVISRLDGLRVIQTLSAGVDHYVELIPPGVTLCDASGVHDVSVSEWVVMAVLASIRNLPQHLQAQRRARWPAKPAPEGDDLEGSTVAPFGVRFLRVALHPRDGVSPVTELPALLPQSDIVVVLLPLTDATRGFVDADLIARMRSGALLVNAARGPIVDTASLTAALQEGRIRAALDVTDPEPLTPGHPLWSAPGVLITPHIGGWVRKMLDRSWRLVADQVGRFSRGEPLRNVVVDGY
jgi:phosphoglycerate dehydrogenase-like enzyme